MSPRLPLSVGLTRERIVSEALTVIDAGGIGALTIRSLARRLNVNPTAIAWHVGTHEKLLSYVVASALRTPLQVDQESGWQSQVIAIGQSFRHDLHRHPNLAQLVGTQLTTNAVSHDETFEHLLGALIESGLRDEALLEHFDAVVGSVVGYVVIELGCPPDDGRAEWSEAVRERSQSINKSTHPNLYGVRNEIGKHFGFRSVNGSHIPLDGGFATLLKLLVIGIEHQVQVESGSASS